MEGGEGAEEVRREEGRGAIFRIQSDEECCHCPALALAAAADAAGVDVLAGLAEQSGWGHPLTDRPAGRSLSVPRPPPTGVPVIRSWHVAA